MDNQKIKIIFYNNWHCGDIFFAQPFIKNIVEHNNETFEYYFYCEYCDYIYTSVIPNIKNIKYETELLDIYKNIHMKMYIHNDFIYFDESKILLINTWIEPMFKHGLIECDLISYIRCYEIVLFNILQQHNIQINYNNDIQLAYPIIKELNIDYFLNFKEMNKDKKIIFYYNYLQSSGQRLPINTHANHNYVIERLAQDNIVILPDKSNYTNCTDNIYFADDFLDKENNDLSEDNYNGKNLCYYATISYHSHLSIYYDIGRCFMYANQKSIQENNENIRLHLAVKDFYFNSINNNLYVKPDYVKLMITSNYIDVIEKIQNELSFIKNS